MSKSKHKITRRDFINGMQVAVGGALISPLLHVCQQDIQDYSLPLDYYPPLKSGMRGNHDGSWEVMHAQLQGKTWPQPKQTESYDLVVVGAGISGLAAAYFYQKEMPDARILILDNHDDFGGHAKRNEFIYNGQTIIGYGGTEAIDTPSAYAPESVQLLREIGVRTQKFYDYYHTDLYKSMGLSKSIFFDEDSFGTNTLVTGYGKRPWSAFAADTPMTAKAKADFIRVQTSKKDYLPGLSMEEKIKILSKTSYEDFLRNYCQIDEQVINIYKRWGMSFWTVGIDEIPTTSIQSYDGGMPGVEHTLIRTGHRNDEPYIFHFPDGNATVARLLVRALIADSLPGETMEDSVTAKLNYAALDRSGQGVNVRLNSTVVNVENSKNEESVDLVYVRNGKSFKVNAKKCVMACYNMAIPYLCPELGEGQKQALKQGIKSPLVYTKVLVQNWKPFAELATDFIYYPTGFYKQVELAYPVSLGNYKASLSPDDPMILHMCHVPWVPDIKGPEQWQKGRHQMLVTPFSTFEDHVKKQLSQALGAAGFDANRDIKAITVNRWPHGYAYNPELIWEQEYQSENEKPWVIGRQAFGNIHIANSDAGAKANTNCAISQAYRAVSEILV